MKKCNCLFAPPLNLETKYEVMLLAARIFVGLSMAFAHGFKKLPPPEGLISGVTEMGFPLPVLFAWCAALSEFVGGILIAFGLLTRPAALTWVVTMAVAGFFVHAADPYQVKELAFLYLAFSIVLLSVGPGRFSLDAVISKKCKE